MNYLLYICCMNDKLKGLIFDKLYRRLGNAEIIPYNNSIWFIDRENEFWFFELSGDGCLWWRYHFFISFFNMFSLSQSDFEPIISSWVEEVLNHKVSTARKRKINPGISVEEVLNHKVSMVNGFLGKSKYVVEDVLNHKVSTTNVYGVPPSFQIEEILNHTVHTTSYDTLINHSLVEEVLNHKVSRTIEIKDTKMYYEVKDILNNTIKRTKPVVYLNGSVVKEILKYSITKVIGFPLLSVNWLRKVLKKN